MLAKATFSTTTETNPLRKLLSHVEDVSFLETRAIEFIIEARETSDSARYEELMVEATRCITKARIAQLRAVEALKSRKDAEQERINEAGAARPDYKDQ